jgi:hypothetical protein
MKMKAHDGRLRVETLKRLTAIAVMVLAGCASGSATLVVAMGQPKQTGSKAVVKLEMQNTFAERIASARAVCFLLDEKGKVLGQSTQWVIGGGEDKPTLASQGKTTFHFVLPVEKAGMTNLTAKVSFSRLILEGGKLADIAKDVTVQPADR